MSEIKWVTVSTNIATSYQVWSLTNIIPSVAQGPDKANRIGDKVRYKFLTFDAMATCGPPSAISVAQILQCRVALIQPRISTPNVVDIAPTGVATLDQTTVWLPLNGVNCMVLKDWKFILPAADTATAGSTNLPVAKKLKYHKRHIRNVLFKTFNINTPVKPQAELYLLTAFTGPATASTNTFSVIENLRMSYIDI